MKTSFIKKAALSAVGIFAFGVLSAQQTTGDITQQTSAVRVIDNKGTVKYLQTSNGLTQLTNTTNDVTTTTWQLGGTFISDTSLDLATFDLEIDGADFSLENIATTTATAATSTSATSDGSTNEYTLLVRNEATGNIEKLIATDLLEGGQELFTATATEVATPVFTLAGGVTLPAFQTVYVYRNGAKLIAGVDYTVSGSDVTLVPGGTAPNDWALLVGDRIEVHFVK